MSLKPKIFLNRGADLIERRKGGGRLVFLGLPFFLVGLFVTQFLLVLSLSNLRHGLLLWLSCGL